MSTLRFLRYSLSVWSKRFYISLFIWCSCFELTRVNRYVSCYFLLIFRDAKLFFMGILSMIVFSLLVLVCDHGIRASQVGMVLTMKTITTILQQEQQRGDPHVHVPIHRRYFCG